MQQLHFMIIIRDLPFYVNTHDYIAIITNYDYRSDQLSDPDPKDSVAEIEKYAESDHFGSGNNHEDTVDENNQPSDSKQTRVC